MGLEALIALPVVKKVLDVVRYVVDGERVQWKQLGLVVGSWVVGVGVAALVAASGYAESVGFVDPSLSDLIIAGVTIGSGAGVIADATHVTIS